MERGGETDTLRIGFQAYVLPLGAWEALLGTRQLYYRLVTQSEGMATGPVYVMELTGDAVVSTNDKKQRCALMRCCGACRESFGDYLEIPRSAVAPIAAS
jgi:hypothetical protein